MGSQASIQGRVKVQGVAEYTSEKCSSACHCLKESWMDAQQSSSGEAIIRWCADMCMWMAIFCDERENIYDNYKYLMYSRSAHS